MHHIKIIFWVLAIACVGLSLSDTHVHAATTQELVKNGNFESGNVLWDYDTSLVTPIINATDMSGSWYALLGFTDENDYIGQIITLPHNATSITHSLDVIVADDPNPAYTGGFAVISVVDVHTNEILFLDTYQDTNFAGTLTADLTPYRGRTVALLYVNYDTDSTKPGSEPEIFMGVDNVSVRVTLSDLTPIYRLYNTKSGVHLYTKGIADRDKILNKFPVFEFTDGGAAFYASLTDDGTTPIYRLYNTRSGVHLYTKGIADRDKILNKFPVFEFTDGGPAFYASLKPQIGLTPIYRLYNTRSGVHLYTKGIADRDKILNKFPVFEFTDGGAAFYASLTP